jgi:hypothetical protein
MSSKISLSRLFRKAGRLSDGSRGAVAHADSLAPRVLVDNAAESITKPSTSNSTASLSPVERLWFQAYNSLRTEDPSLVRDFEALSLVLSTGSGSESQNIIGHDRPAHQEELRLLIRVGLERTEKEARLKKGLSDVLGVILKAKDAVDSAIQAVPHAALAWSGVCLTLEVRVKTRSSYVY